MDEVIYTNDRKEKYQSCEAEYSKNVSKEMFYFYININAYGSNKKESQDNLLDAIEEIIQDLQKQQLIIKESI